MRSAYARVRYIWYAYRVATWTEETAYSIGPPIRNPHLEWGSDYYLLLQTLATFLYPVSSPPNLSNRGLFARVHGKCFFVLTAAILKGCPCFEWAAVLAAETKTAARRHQQRLRNLESAPPLVLELYNGKLVTQTWTIYIFFVCTWCTI